MEIVLCYCKSGEMKDVLFDVGTGFAIDLTALEKKASLKKGSLLIPANNSQNTNFSITPQ
ncbi:hypothetical protein hmeg3_01885 [Herbaspirillum sp. meg3]|uniref:hypothetical protein n=1 Tax=Herbaspirillum sp. meg3 TaxID=2025949 RepID=UPI000B98B96A|nr:hypothetical protein [Herbaspirillum sp. meg3]ASU37167.1 hypothetical protein hmeg3_01885 [Herbaspirillum sp. meg3]